MSKRYYESYLIIDGNLEDTAIEDVIRKYESLLIKNEVEINNIDRIGRKRLSYLIKKRLTGYYVCFEILSSPQFISKLERTYILDESILRYLTIFMSSKALKEKEEHLKNRAIFQSKFEESKLLAEAEKNAEENSTIKKDSSIDEEKVVAVAGEEVLAAVEEKVENEPKE